MGVIKTEKEIDWVTVCKAYDELKKGFLSMRYSEDEAWKAAANVMAAMMMAGEISGSRTVIKEIIFSERGKDGDN